jgi:hypothetical protein
MFLKENKSTIIALEYFNAKIQTTRMASKDGRTQIQKSILLKRANGFTTAEAEDFLISTEDENETIILQWFDLIKERVSIVVNLQH